LITNQLEELSNKGVDTMNIINIPIKDNEYNVYISNNLLSHLEDYIDVSRETVIITDTNIPPVYLEKIKPKFNDLVIKFIPQGEHSKSMEIAYLLINELLDMNVSRSSQFIALGGGVVGDLTGFISSIYMRGVDFIQIPTTLLSQIDSSVGGKTGINSENSKNSIGSFKQPIAVLIDPLTLLTLEDRQLYNGYAEMIKYALIRSKPLYESLLKDDIMSNIEQKIYDCLIIKKDIVLQDTFDKGERQLLNFGHTIGHAIEQYSKYNLLHGEAISVGMVNITTNPIIKSSICKLLTKYNLPQSYEYDKSEIFNIIKNDKKVASNKINIAFVEELGNGFITSISIEKMKEYL